MQFLKLKKLKLKRTYKGEDINKMKNILEKLLTKLFTLFAFVLPVVLPFYLASKINLWYDLGLVADNSEFILYPITGIIVGYLFVVGIEKTYRLETIISQIFIILSASHFPLFVDFIRRFTLGYFEVFSNIANSFMDIFYDKFFVLYVFFYLLKLTLVAAVETILYWCIIYGISILLFRGIMYVFFIICKKLSIPIDKTKEKVDKKIRISSNRINSLKERKEQESYKVMKCKKCGQKMLSDKRSSESIKCPRCGNENN